MLRKKSLSVLRHLSRRLGFWRLENPILIYQMGKVGSAAVLRAIEALGYSVGHVASSEDNCDYDVIHTHSHDFVSKFLSMRRPNGNQLIITGVRDLLKRNISAFFQNFDDKENDWWYFGTRDEIEHGQTNDLIHFSNSRHPVHFQNLVEPWFDEFRDATGVDVYLHRFPTELGWLETERPVKIFVYRAEDIQQYGQALAHFLRKPTLSVGRANVGAEKWYSAKYRMFIAEYEPPSFRFGNDIQSEIPRMTTRGHR